MPLFTKKPQTDEQQVQYSTDSLAGKTVSEIKIPAVLVQPRVSEKAGALAKLNKYVFRVKPAANKVEIKKAVENFYKVKVTQVNIINTEGKKRNYGRTSGRMSDFKKAVVTLRKGDSIAGLTETV